MFVKKHFANLKYAYLKLQKYQGVIMPNVHDTIFYMKKNVLQDLHICMSVPSKHLLHVEICTR